MQNILIIAAHPDDDILGCAGIMSKFREKAIFRVIFIAEGSSCRYNKDEINETYVSDVIDSRNKAGIRALSLLGVKNYKFYNLPCGRLDQTPIIEINKIIESEIAKFKPDTIFTHSYEDTNNDHKIVHRATQMATRPGSHVCVKSVYAYEVLSSSEWRFTDAFLPNYFEPLSECDVKKKWLALCEYETEVKEFPYPRSEEGIFTLSKYRGMQCANEYAEAFKLIRHINKEAEPIGTQI